MTIRNYGLAVLLALLAFAAAALICGSMLEVYLDIPNALLILAFPFFFQWLLFGKADLVTAFTAPFKKEPSMEELATGKLFFKSYRRATWITALMVMIISIIAMLWFLEDKSALGPTMSVLLLSALYAGLVDMLVIFPCLTALKKRMIPFGGDS